MFPFPDGWYEYCINHPWSWQASLTIFVYFAELIFVLGVLPYVGCKLDEKYDWTRRFVRMVDRLLYRIFVK